MDYHDFELKVRSAGGKDYEIEVRSPGGEKTSTVRFPFDELALETRLQALEIALLKSSGTRRDIRVAEQDTVEDFGKDLFDTLIGGEIRDLYRYSRRKAEEEGRGLRLRLRVEAPDLASLPWEYMYDDSEGDFVCLSTETPLIRYLELDRPATPLTIEPPLRVLGMVASPKDRTALDVEREKGRVERATERLRKGGLLELTWLPGQSWRDLQKAMRRGPWHVFHFVGHGGFDPGSGEGLIALVDDDGSTFRLSAKQLGMLLADHNTLRLVLLNSCEGAKGNDSDIFSSTASILMRRGLPAVVAMQYEITDRAAIEFAQVFYEDIAEGLSVDAAVAEARKAISLSLENSLEWGTPVLYMRAPDGVLFDIQGQSITEVLEAQKRPEPEPATPEKEAAPETTGAPAPETTESASSEAAPETTGALGTGTTESASSEAATLPTPSVEAPAAPAPDAEPDGSPTAPQGPAAVPTGAGAPSIPAEVPSPAPPTPAPPQTLLDATPTARKPWWKKPGVVGGGVGVALVLGLVIKSLLPPPLPDVDQVLVSPADPVEMGETTRMDLVLQAGGFAIDPFEILEYEVTWESESPAVATVEEIMDEGSGERWAEVRGVRPGTARIVATVDGMSDGRVITVTVPVDSITAAASAWSEARGEIDSGALDDVQVKAQLDALAVRFDYALEPAGIAAGVVAAQKDLQGLIDARAQIEADENVGLTLLQRQERWSDFRAEVESVRPTSPTIADARERLGALQTIRENYATLAVSRAGNLDICPGSGLCRGRASEAGVLSVTDPFRPGTLSATARVAVPRSGGTVHYRWMKGDDELRLESFRLRGGESGERRYDPLSVSDPGRYEVRIYNDNRQEGGRVGDLIGRIEFCVTSCS